ncbi:MAG: hypothetical protein ACI89D_001580, partial [Bermanella sp.]
NRPRRPIDGMTVVAVDSLAQAIEAM